MSPTSDMAWSSWLIASDGYLLACLDAPVTYDNSFGVRPVINIEKSKLS